MLDITKQRSQSQFMSEHRDNLVLERLREIRALLGEVKGGTAELRLRVGMIEAGYASMSLRLDRLGGDMELVKRRLGLLDPAIS